MYTHIEYELDGMHRKVKIIIALKSVSQSVTEIFLSHSQKDDFKLNSLWKI
jgi:hypothetical protein